MSLTKIQTEVADLICAGLLHKEIADQLQVGKKTIDKRIMSLYAKTDTHCVGQLFWWMLRNKAGNTYEKAKAVING